MKTLKTNQVLVNFEGQKMVEGDKEITIGYLLTNLLSSTTNNPHRAYQLARQIATEKTVELKAEDIVFLKEVLGKSTLGAIYTGQVIDILEAKDTK